MNNIKARILHIPFSSIYIKKKNHNEGKEKEKPRLRIDKEEIRNITNREETNKERTRRYIEEKQARKTDKS